MKTLLHTFRLIFISLVLAGGVALRAAPASDHTPIHLQADIVYKTTAAGELHLDLFYPATELVGAYPLVVSTPMAAAGRLCYRRSSKSEDGCPTRVVPFEIKLFRFGMRSHTREGVTQSRDRRGGGFVLV